MGVWRVCYSKIRFLFGSMTGHHDPGYLSSSPTHHHGGIRELGLFSVGVTALTQLLVPDGQLRPALHHVGHKGQAAVGGGEVLREEGGTIQSRNKQDSALQ